MKKTFLYIALCLVSIAGIHAQTGNPAIDQAIADGQFTLAQQLIREGIASGNLSPQTAWEWQLQSDILDRTRIDFNRDEAYVRRTLGKYYAVETQNFASLLHKWEKSGVLENRLIDGEKRYFRNAVWNLFRIDQEARARKEAVDGKAADKLGEYLSGYLPIAYKYIAGSDRPIAQPRQMRLRYTLTVEANAVPAGEMLRAWLPYPRSGHNRQAAVQLLGASAAHYVVAPPAYPHSTIYMEKPAEKDSVTRFQYEVTYTAYDEWHNLEGGAVKPYDTSSDLYRYYTAERESHILFTPELKQLSTRIVGTETDPVRKARLIFDWIGENIPWTSALEYSTIPNIPAYCIRNSRGDCGIKALLFITLCRYNGIPAKWQSGWMLYPGNLNLHDWAEIYFEGPGWVPVDPDLNRQQTFVPEADLFFFGGADAWHFIVNDDFSGPFFPAKVFPRSETVDFQRGEVEWRGGNLYFDTWDYEMEVGGDD